MDIFGYEDDDDIKVGISLLHLAMGLIPSLKSTSSLVKARTLTRRMSQIYDETLKHFHSNSKGWSRKLNISSWRHPKEYKVLTIPLQPLKMYTKWDIISTQKNLPMELFGKDIFLFSVTLCTKCIFDQFSAPNESQVLPCK
jgi:hypothetical protein